MLFADALTLDAPRRTRDGYLAVRAKVARTGVYQYTGREVDPDNAHGLRDRAIVNVLRDEATVFDKAAVHSFIGKPITDNHPREVVTADNWRNHARGTIMGALRDGEALAFDLLLTDASAIAAVDSGKRELSNGYAAELEFGDFRAADGTPCQARQSKITGGNHVALVDRGRAGPECRIADAFALCDANPQAVARLSQAKEDRVKVTNLDGLSVNLTDASAVEQAITTLDGKLSKAAADLADANGKFATLTGEKAVLESKLKDAEAKIAPGALDKLVADRAALVAKAKSIKPDLVTDGKTDAEIRKDALGAVADGLDDAAVAGAFAYATKDAKTESDRVQSLGTPRAVTTNDNASVRDFVRTGRY
ncbi:DUF2213 domain-containing protein [Sphingomonas sp.]|uniref:DUF2213 domain-containing protein n=1 Tax=Sphingomonas sp. TaxID=28214 RepID=UPI003BAB88E0